MIVGIKGKSFPLSLGLFNDYGCAIELDATELCYKRLGHLSPISFKKINSSLLLKDLPSIQEKVVECEACQLGNKLGCPFLIKPK